MKRREMFGFVVSIVLGFALTGVYFLTNPKKTSVPHPDTEAALMQKGLETLYSNLKRPKSASKYFEEVLTLNPKHYGALYQAAVSLDMAGERDRALGMAEVFRERATELNDQASLKLLQSRFGCSKPMKVPCLDFEREMIFQ